MNNGLGILLIALATGVCSLALLVLLRVLAPDFTAEVREAAEASAGRAFWIGVLNLLFIGVVVVGLYALFQNIGVEALFILPMLMTAVVVVALLYGLAAMASYLGDGLGGAAEPWRATLKGGLLLLLASLTPYVGWFLIFPYLGLRGFGAVIQTSLARVRARRAEKTEA